MDVKTGIGTGIAPGRGPWQRPYATKLVAAALGIAILIAGTAIAFPTHPAHAFTVYEAVIVFITVWAGRIPGFLTLGSLTVLAAYFLLKGDGLAVADPTEAAGLVAFVLAGLFLIATIGLLTSRLASAEETSATVRAEGAGKSALLSEMSHRVFNDLSSLTSLATIQANAAKETETREALKEMADRILVFAAVYKRLHADAKQTGSLDMHGFLNDLCDDLRTAHLGLRPVSLELEAERCRMSVARAALVGIVLNETVVNALKYAFPDERPGTIRIAFGRDPEAAGSLRLTVSDDGVGPVGTQPKGTGMGQRLLRAMASQLNGSYGLERTGEVTIARLRFAAE